MLLDFDKGRQRGVRQAQFSLYNVGIEEYKQWVSRGGIDRITMETTMDADRDYTNADLAALPDDDLVALSREAYRRLVQVQTGRITH